MAKTPLRFVFVVVLVSVCISGARCDAEVESSDVQEAGEGRTFGHHFLKRLSFAMIPIMYKMGMMTTLLITLTIMSTKGLAVGVLLLILAISQIISRSVAPAAAAAAPVYQAPYAAPAYAQPAVYPVVYSRADAPAVIHKVAAHTTHAAYQQPYGTSGWHSPYAREDVDVDERTEYEH